MYKREFRATGEYAYDRSGPVRWIVSHAMRYPILPLGVMLAGVLASIVGSQAPRYLGRTFDHVLSTERNARTLLGLSLAVIACKLGEAALDAIHRVFGEFLSRRVERDARDELYVSLLGKSLGFHSTQRIGDLIARAIGDVRGLNHMFSPGLRVIFIALVRLVVPLVAIGAIHASLLPVPLALVLAMATTLWLYGRQLKPVKDAQRDQFGRLTAGLAESLAGVEVVKGHTQEAQKGDKFRMAASRTRDLYVRYGDIEARYLPTLVQPAIIALGFVHAVYLYGQGAISLGSVVAYVALLGQMHYTRNQIVSVIVGGVSSAERILEMVNAESELDENPAGVHREMRGQVTFERVGFAYDGNPVLSEISFDAQPGETVAIVGQTGSGKTSLTRLINRIYDTTAGRVLIDGVDVRAWNLSSLRSQVASIEQDVFLYARSIRENIAFGAGKDVPQEEIGRCAREAQAHAFITRLPGGYDAVIGERGVTLSGGQRQRIAIARALLADPRILILDDSTSAIDSATEDQIQAAIRRAQEGRTTFIITHRLSQIRWADRILVLRRGELMDQGGHEELMERCGDYRRIFGRRKA